MNIKEDLQKGREGEDQVINMLKSIGIDSGYNENKKTLKYWDIECSGKNRQFKVEVKNDLMAEKTGNLAIEVCNPRSGKETGISVTKSDIWVHIVGQTLWGCNTNRLKNFVSNNKPVREVKYAGDGNATIYLYEASKILDKIFTRLENLSKNELETAIKKLLVNQ